MPVVNASTQALEGYGSLVDDPDQCHVEIVRWPAQGSRPVDENTGDGAGTTKGVFTSEWQGDILYGRNQAVGGHYILAYGTLPELADASHQRPPAQFLMWHGNYHPDGGQLFYPLDKKPFMVPLALPGDDIRPEKWVCFRFDGTQGFYIHPNIWHEAVFPLAARASFHDEQGKVHARVSCNIAVEFGVFLSVPLAPPA